MSGGVKMARKKHDSEPEGAKVWRITWVKSSIGYSRRQKATLQALGLKRLGQTVEQKATPVIQGMVQKVSHLVEVEEVKG